MMNILGVRDEERKKTLMLFNGNKVAVSTDLLQTQLFKTYQVEESSPVAKYVSTGAEEEKIKSDFYAALATKIDKAEPVSVENYKKVNNSTAFHDTYMVENGLYNHIQNTLSGISKYNERLEDSDLFKFFKLLTSNIEQSFDVDLYYQERETVLEIVWFKGQPFAWKDIVNFGEIRSKELITAIITGQYFANLNSQYIAAPALCFSRTKMSHSYNSAMIDAAIYYICNNTDIIKETDDEELIDLVNSNIGDFIL